MKRKDLEQYYALIASDGTVLAQGHLESPPDASTLYVRVPEDKVEAVMEHEDIQLIGAMDNALLGRILRNRNEVIVLEKLKSLGAEARQNLRVPTHFDSFIYPLTGAWKGRCTVECNDLSCGGISFFSTAELADGERVEIVIPVTEEPLILSCQILRRRPSGRSEPLYAAKFDDLCDDEEMLVREAVFNIQLQSRPRTENE